MSFVAIALACGEPLLPTPPDCPNSLDRMVQTEMVLRGLLALLASSLPGAYARHAAGMGS